MNAFQRKQLAEAVAKLRQVPSQLSTTVVKDLIEIARDTAREVLDDEQDKYDNLTDAQQNGVVGERLMDAINELEPILDYLESIDLSTIPESGTEDREEFNDEINDAADNMETI